jgi:hypothetical protein
VLLQLAVAVYGMLHLIQIKDDLDKMCATQVIEHAGLPDRHTALARELAELQNSPDRVCTQTSLSYYDSAYRETH